MKDSSNENEPPVEPRNVFGQYKELALVLIGAILAILGGFANQWAGAAFAASRQEDEQTERRFYEQMKVIDSFTEVHSKDLFAARELMAAISAGVDTEQFEQRYLECRKTWEEVHPGLQAKFSGFFGREAALSYIEVAKAMDTLHVGLQEASRNDNSNPDELDAIEERTHLLIIEHSILCIKQAQTGSWSR